MKNDQATRLLLRKETALMHKAALALERSWKDCQSMPKEVFFHPEDLDKLELLSSRFSRFTDFMILRIFRLVDEIELEVPGTVRDIINRAEKKGLIGNADSFVESRILRNRIAHEYVEKVMTEIFEETIRLVPSLLEAVKRTDAYIRKFD